ncbi:MAG: cupin domain-containing protein [Nostoc sp. DedQUE08]|uniref:cupin domain-containing protein n=2 Tax=Nostoc TaxID=1177 RepID=UPI002AD45551|nr:MULTISPECIES: cupin domain-containing protein [unclassified Nostoc]MDZ8067200.1 cupin domain-containing protein [Nostoc sp. DedQUE08]MDZ8096421.1 cupin domain-containing protein [Nostoc sp. DedQUE05]MDZ8128164.1 cupin domain-containing protein [Nostoc sp. DedQUE07]
MTVITPDSLIVEESPSHAAHKPNRMLWISEAGGLTQFGAFIEVLQPGSRSSIKHWHSAEDEMVYVLEGEIVLIEGDAKTVLRPGDAATFQAGVPIGHFLENRSSKATQCLIVGTRAEVDTITYPDHDRVCHRNRSLPDDIWTNGAGEPASSPY